MRVVKTVALAVLLFAPACLAAQTASYSSAPNSLPSRGWLLLEGGGRLSGTEIPSRFVALAGGPSRHIVVISTAISDTEYAPSRVARCEIRSAEIFVVPHVTCLEARDRAEANSPTFVAAVREADGVWFYGGDEERYVDRYVGTAAVQAFRDVLDRGGVLGGTSAGAMILASYIPARDSLAVSAFEFLPHATIAPHYTQRHYEAELRRDLERHPGLRGIGIDEATAIVVHGHEFEVIGGGTVTVVDHHVTVLTRGQRFDLQRGTIVARHSGT